MKRQQFIKSLFTAVFMLFLSMMMYGQPPKAASNPTAEGSGPDCYRLTDNIFKYYVTYEAGVVFYPSEILINGQDEDIVSISELDYHLVDELYEKQVTVVLTEEFSNFFQNAQMNVTVVLTWEQGTICGSASATQSSDILNYDQCSINGFSSTVENREQGSPQLKHLYPNPVTEHVIIHFMPHITGNTTIEIMNEAGNIVKKISMSSDQIRTERKTEIAVHDLQPGMYIARISTGGQQTFKKFVKN